MQTGKKHPPTRSSAYEIGSITKVFTSTLLALAVQQTQPTIQLNTPVVDVLASTTHLSLPHFPKAITLEHLSTHTSGLPRLPSDWNFYWNLFRHQSNPYSAYHQSNLETSLKKYRDRDEEEIGTHFEYSNFGVGLLGFLLTQVITTPDMDSCFSSEHLGNAHHTTTNTSAVAYEALVQTCIAEPLKLESTTMELYSELLPGYTERGKETDHWTMDALAGCGGLHSTLPDMIKFGVANLRAARKHSSGKDLTKLDKAMHLCHESHFDVDKDYSIGLGWILETNQTSGTTIIWHNGGTYGASTYLGWEKESGVVVVVLINTAAGAIDATPLGRQIIQHAVEQATSSRQANGETNPSGTVEDHVVLQGNNNRIGHVEETPLAM